MLQGSHLRYYTIITVISCLVGIVCSVSNAAADTTNPGAEGLMPDPDAIIRKILGIDEMAKNVCLISSHQMVNAADLPGRLISISPDRKMPSDLLRYSFRRPGAQVKTQVNPPTTPIQVTRLESSQVHSGSLLSWFGAGMSREDIAELRTMPLPATSISVDDLDEDSITHRFSTVPEDVRKGLGIITDVIPYEIWASICRKTTSKTEAGVWYIKLGRDTYSKMSDELRKYYLVAVYTPIVFYDDIGVISGTKSTTWLPGTPVKNRKEALSLWLKEQTNVPRPGKFSTEREVGWIDAPEQVSPKPEGNTQNGTTDITIEQPKDNGSSGMTTVMPK